MSTFEPGTPVWHPKHGFGISYKNPSRSEAVCYANEVGDYAVSLYLNGWERARIAGPDEVIVKVDDLKLGDWVDRTENEYGSFGKAVIRAAKAWAELRNVESQNQTSESKSLNDDSGSANEDEQPQRVKDRVGDIWERQEDGTWLCEDGTLFQTLARISASWGPLTVLDDEPDNFKTKQLLHFPGGEQILNRDQLEAVARPEMKSGQTCQDEQPTAEVSVPCPDCGEQITRTVRIESNGKGKHTLGFIPVKGQVGTRAHACKPAQPDEPQEFGAKVTVTTLEGIREKWLRTTTRTTEAWALEDGERYGFFNAVTWEVVTERGTTTLSWDE